jgi:hypothetical protein
MSQSGMSLFSAFQAEVRDQYMSPETLFWPSFFVSAVGMFALCCKNNLPKLFPWIRVVTEPNFYEIRCFIIEFTTAHN